MLKRGPILGLIYRLVISLFIFRRKLTSRSSRGLCCKEADYKEQNYSKQNFVLIHKLSVILISFCCSGKKIRSRGKRGCSRAEDTFLRES